eukprot:1815128-Pleurochrysis_carterae.AAC.1
MTCCAPRAWQRSASVLPKSSPSYWRRNEALTCPSPSAVSSTCRMPTMTSCDSASAKSTTSASPAGSGGSGTNVQYWEGQSGYRSPFCLDIIGRRSSSPNH